MAEIKPKYNIKTFGCQMNYSDSERVSSYLETLGYENTQEMDEADIIIFNTCSIKQKAEDKALGFMRKIRRLKTKNPDLLMVITGCMIRQSSSRYSSKRDRLFNKVKELDIALRIESLPKFAGLVREINPDLNFQNIPEEELVDYFKINPNYSSDFQAFVPVSTGCDKFCTYCIVPFSRGREKCRAIDDIFNECQNLVENGCKEITLIGQTVNSYGLNVYDKVQKTFNDLPKGKEPFVHLLEQLETLNKRGLERVRFTSPHPKDTTDQLIEAMAKLKTQMPYIHMPLQSGDNEILKRMNRTYTIEHYMEVIQKLKKAIPNIAISTDIIVGFCGETEEQFMTSYKIFEEVGFDLAYISQYSERKGTFANEHMEDDIPRDVKKKEIS
ncbi:tRNA (N6-isopentenyl adenosine(37)-C2)-methylthiotransferase MiaB [Patescibacteria group bacterium]